MADRHALDDLPGPPQPAQPPATAAPTTAPGTPGTPVTPVTPVTPPSTVDRQKQPTGAEWWLHQGKELGGGLLQGLAQDVSGSLKPQSELQQLVHQNVRQMNRLPPEANHPEIRQFLTDFAKSNPNDSWARWLGQGIGNWLPAAFIPGRRAAAVGEAIERAPGVAKVAKTIENWVARREASFGASKTAARQAGQAASRRFYDRIRTAGRTAGRGAAGAAGGAIQPGDESTRTRNAIIGGLAAALLGPAGRFVGDPPHYLTYGRYLPGGLAAAALHNLAGTPWLESLIGAAAGQSAFSGLARLAEKLGPGLTGAGAAKVTPYVTHPMDTLDKAVRAAGEGASTFLGGTTD